MRASAAGIRIAAWILVMAAVATPARPAAPAAGKQAAKAPAKPAAARKPTTSDLLKMIEEQKAFIAEQQRLLAEQQARIADQEAGLAEQRAALERQAAQLAEVEGRLAAMVEQLAAIQRELPAPAEQQAITERLERVEKAAEKEPELPATAVSAGDFPGSIRIPGTDAAIKIGGRVRTAAVATLGPLGSEDRFLTNSIPVDPDDDAAGKGPRTTFSANTSRFNFDVRTPTGVGHMRAFIEGDFFGSSTTEKRTSFRMRHAFAQFRGLLLGQTWSTFSDPEANHQDLDFEGINGENVIRQPQFRYTWRVGERWSLAAAAETPQVSLTGGQGVNLVPDAVGRAIWTFKENGHLQTALVLRQIRGEWDLDPGSVKSAGAVGATLSGVVPIPYLDRSDRFIFQLNFGKGVARYINDLNSLGGQDAVFDGATGALEALYATGAYVDFEHQWKQWKTARDMKLRSSLIWSYVAVDNLDSQPDDAYRRTHRVSINMVFSPIPRIDAGVEYIYGARENKDGHRGTSDQFQVVGIFRF